MGKKRTNQQSDEKSKPGPKEERLIIEGDPDEALRRFLRPDKKRKRKRDKDG